MLNNKTFKELSKVRSTYCVSIYVPAHQTKRGMESKSFFKRMLSDAREELAKQGLEEKAAHRFLFNAYELLNEPLYWKDMQYALGIFIADGFFKMLKIPYEAGPYYTVAERFYLRPLIPAVNGESVFYVLAMPEAGPRLYEGGPYALQPVGADEMLPGSMAEALAESSQEGNVQRQSGQSAFETPIFKGNEGELGSEHQLKQLKRFFYQVDQGVNAIIGEERAPLVLAMPDYMAPVYKETSDYLDIAPVHVSGEPKEANLNALHSKALEIVNNYFRDGQQAQARLFKEQNEGEGASSSVLEILPKAAEGKVQTLFVARNRHSWGQYDEEKNAVELFKENKPKSLDLMSLAATYTHLHGGKVYILPAEEMPQPSANICAIYR